MGSYLSRTEGLFRWVYLKWSESDADERNEGPVEKKERAAFGGARCSGNCCQQCPEGFLFAGESFSKDFLYEKSSSYVSFPLTFHTTA